MPLRRIRCHIIDITPLLLRHYFDTPLLRHIARHYIIDIMPLAIIDAIIIIIDTPLILLILPLYAAIIIDTLLH
jgi:hypothetical protein